MKENEIDPKKLSGEGLYYYYTNDHVDEDYRSTIELLPVALGWDMDKVYSALEKAVKEDKTFVAVYPGQEETPVDTEGMEYVGPIDDGGVYLK